MFAIRLQKPIADSSPQLVGSIFDVVKGLRTADETIILLGRDPVSMVEPGSQNRPIEVNIDLVMDLVYYN